MSNRFYKKTKSLFFCFVVVFTLLNSSILPSLSGKASAAAKINLSWNKTPTISVSGDTQGTLTPTNGTGVVSAEGNVKDLNFTYQGHNGKCNYFYGTADLANNTYTLQSINQSAIGASSARVACYAEFLGLIGPIAIQGTRPGGSAGTAAEDAASRTWIITLFAPLTSNPPGSVTFTLKHKNGGNVSSPVVGRTEVKDPTGKELLYYQYQHNFELDKGEYTICFDSVLKTCTSNINKRYGIPGQSSYGDDGASARNRIILARVKTSLIANIGGTASSSTFTLVLKQNDKVIQTAVTNSFSHAPTTAQQGTLGGKIELIADQEATFDNVAAGKYQVCIASENICADVTKEDGHPGNPYPVELTATAFDPLGLNTVSDGSNHPTCESGGDGLNWILCPIFNTVADFTDFLFSTLFQPLLRTAPISTDPSQTSYKVWSNFRIYGDIFLVIALLVIVFGQAIGGGLVDAYTAKKVLPRLLAAAILINLSIYIVALAVDFTNILGGGLGRLITGPIKEAGAFKISPSGVQAGVITGLPVAAVGIGAALLGIGGLLSIGVAALSGSLTLLLLFVILPVAFGLLIAFVTLLLRKAILLALVFVSPIAFALYCLPNTEKYFQKWWSLFTKTLLVYPIVIVIFAVADVLSVTVSSANNSNNPLASLISFILQFLPLFLIPYAFKLAGGAIGQISGAMSGFSKRAQEGIKGDARNPNSLRNRAKRRFGERVTTAEARIATPGQSGSSTRRQQRAMRAINRIDRGWNSRESKYTAEATAREDQISATGRDDQRYAANWFSVGAGQAAPVGVSDKGVDVSGTTSSSERFFDSKGRVISKAFAKQSEALHATSAFDAGRNLEYPLRKAQTDDDLANYRRGFAATALRKGLTEDEIMGMHARASFEHKDKHPSEWYSTPSLVPGQNGSADRIVWADTTDNTRAGRRGQAAHVKELHKSKASFQLSSLRDKELRSWSDRRNEIQDQLDAGAPLSHEDALFFAQTDELMGSLVQQGVIMQSGDEGPQMSAQGVSAAAANTLKAMASPSNRRYETTAARDGTTAAGAPLASVNERVIYSKKAVDAAVAASVLVPGGAPTLSRGDAIHAAAAPIVQPLPRGTTVGTPTIGSTVAVTGDSQSSVIPRYF